MFISIAVLLMTHVYSSKFPGILAQRIPQQVNWSEKNWAHSCSFNHNNNLNVITTLESPADQCGNACEQRSAECSHFNWRPFVDTNIGICELKSGRVRKNDAVMIASGSGFVCGVSLAYNINWNGQNWANGCEFDGSFLIEVSPISADKCGPTCGLDSRCTHFSWRKMTNSGDGVCQLKKGQVTKWDAIANGIEGTVCGVISKAPPGESASVIWYNDDWTYSCVFRNADKKLSAVIADSGSSSADDCRQKCIANRFCTHYTWTGPGGQCSLMKGSVSKADAVTIQTNAVAVCGIVKCSNDSSALRFVNAVYLYSAVICALSFVSMF